MAETNVVKPDEKGEMGGFQILTEGVHNLVFESGIGFSEDEGVETDTLVFPMRDVEEEGTARIFCPLDKKFGQKRLCTVLHYSGIDKLIEKEENLPSLETKGWGINILGSEKLLKIIQVKLPGRVVSAEIKHSTKDGKTYANVNKIAKAGDTPFPAVTKGKEEASDSEGWT